MLTLERPVTGQTIPVVTNEKVDQAIARLGRTEDVCFSPDGRRIALAGYLSDRVLLLDVEPDLDRDEPRVAVSNPLEIRSPAFAEPHGVTWVDDSTLIVANREGLITVLALPDEATATGSVSLEPVQLIGDGGADVIRSPGSLRAIPVGMGLVELLVCNNYISTVSRHLLDARNGYAVLASEILLAEGLNVPDGLAQSPSGEWIAVSNHDDGNGLVFRNDAQLDRNSTADGILTGMLHPHGVRFSADEKTLLVSDAGAPYLYVFRSADGDWSGERAPSETIRLLSEELFMRGHGSPMEGGAKGIDLSSDNRILVATCKMQPLAFFDMRERLGPVPPEDERSPSQIAERARATMIRYLSVARATGLHESEASRRQTEIVRRKLDAVHDSRSWRLSAPIRWVVDRAWELRWKLIERRKSRFP